MGTTEMTDSFSRQSHDHNGNVSHPTDASCWSTLRLTRSLDRLQIYAELVCAQESGRDD